MNICCSVLRGLLAVLVSGFFCTGAVVYACENTPVMRPLPVSQLPALIDEGPRDSLLRAIDESIDYLRRLSPEKQLAFGAATISTQVVLESINSFREIVSQPLPWRSLDRRIKEEFDFYSLSAPPAPPLLVTGYFEPCFAGSMTRTAEYRYPLYRVPSDFAVIVGGNAGEKNGVGRIEAGRFLPYWTRKEIEQGNLLAGHELVFLRDPMEVFILHVQGSGRVVLPDGTERRVQFAAKNGRPYRSIGRLLVQEGKMNAAEVTMPRIVEYVNQHPVDRERILHHNESYVFFRWGDNNDEGPRGCLGRGLTPGRSVAFDQKCYPAAGLAFLMTAQPEFLSGADAEPVWKPMARFVLNQDTGSAIRGGHRADYFFGAGSYAENAAGRMKHPGILYFLIKKRKS
jgi:membrane-bound lytic murein transglycosylase A